MNQPLPVLCRCRWSDAGGVGAHARGAKADGGASDGTGWGGGCRGADRGEEPVLLVCEHASQRLPERIGSLGLSPDALSSHIAWDPGALAVCRLLSAALDATLVYQRFSRLVYDCNRPPEAESAMPQTSEIFAIPGNQG